MNNNYDYPSMNSNRMDYNEFLSTFGLNNINNGFTSNNMNNSGLFGSYDGYMKGNMFKDLYQQYKDYKPAKIMPKSEEEEALLNLDQMHFAMHEANLYLDVYPNDQNMMMQYIKFRDAYNKLLSDYQKKYSAVNSNDKNLNKVPFGWEEGIFPFDRRGL